MAGGTFIALKTLRSDSTMKIVIFGLTVSSSKDNGHAGLWRKLCRDLSGRGHRVVFFEKDLPHFAAHREISELPCGGTLHLYPGWNAVASEARRELRDADVGLITSSCPDLPSAIELLA